MEHLTLERIGDLATLGSVFLAFVLMTYYAVRRTWRWDRLGVALTGVTICLSLLFGLGVYVVLFGGGLWLVHARWVIRSVLTGVAVYAIYVMKTDEPPKGEKS